jgi:tripartite-type tricarboxylate transporter receptor subunit TctC
MRLFKALLALGLLVSAAPALAADYPSRRITMVVPFAPGGSTDIAARVFADRMAQIAGQPVIVENRDGAGGIIGTLHVRDSAPDGYTILFAASGTLVLAPVVNPNAKFNPVEDFRIAGLTSQIVQYFVGAKNGPKNLKELVAAAKADPDKLSYGSAGVGTLSQVGPAAFSTFANAPMEHIPFKGTGQAMTDLIGGHISMMLESASAVRQPLAEKQVIPLAVLTKERTSALPDVPTIGEAGFPGFMELSDWVSWQGIIVPKGTPDDVVAKLNAIINKTLADEKVSSWLAGVDYQNMKDTDVKEANAYFLKSVAQWRKILTDLGLAAN